MTIVITLPAHNESEFLSVAVEVVTKEIAKLTKDYILVIAEDGSIDGTFEIAKRIEEDIHNVRLFHYDKKLGRGAALKRAWAQIDADLYIFLDVDLATDMRYFHKLVKAITEEEYDLATGSRYMKGARVTRPLVREIVSRFYNLLVRFIFRDGIHDHQCGFKAFSRECVKKLVESCENDDWFWDTEAIVRAVKYGFHVHEFPVRWQEKRKMKASFERLIEDVRIHGLGLLKLILSVG